MKVSKRLKRGAELTTECGTLHAVVVVATRNRITLKRDNFARTFDLPR